MSMRAKDETNQVQKVSDYFSYYCIDGQSVWKVIPVGFGNVKAISLKYRLAFLISYRKYGICCRRVYGGIHIRSELIQFLNEDIGYLRRLVADREFYSLLTYLNHGVPPVVSEMCYEGKQL